MHVIKHCALNIQGVSKRALQWCSKCYCVASVTKTFTLEGVQTIHRSGNNYRNVALQVGGVSNLRQ
jgi:hypothetical protein